MNCPKCGNELAEGKLLCEKCGEEVKYVPDFDIELEDKLKESISSMLEELAEEKPETKEPQEMAYGDFEADDELKESLGDYFPQKQLKLWKNRLLLAAAIIAVICVIGAVCFSVILNRLNRSYDYQYERALRCAENNDYAEAAEYLERALEIDSSQADAALLLAEYYDRGGMHESAVSVLTEILTSQTDSGIRAGAYELLLSVYKGQERYDDMNALLAECELSDIVSKYKEYMALPPVFDPEGGDYDGQISITLSGNTEGVVYYTLDGSVPAESALVYDAPILLEAGDYVIRAIFVNQYGVESASAAQSYSVRLTVPESPLVSLDSGAYSEPHLIEVYYNDDAKIYYTTDGSVPNKNSSRYAHPIELPYGVSNFSFIAVDSAGNCSEVVSRSYQFTVEANFDAELALQVLKNNLVAAGKLLDTDGNVSGKLGLNRYRVQTIARVDDGLYYIVYEEYADSAGSAHDTGNIYAVDVNTADLYKAYKLDEGVYRLDGF